MKAAYLIGGNFDRKTILVEDEARQVIIHDVEGTTTEQQQMYMHNIYSYELNDAGNFVFDSLLFGYGVVDKDHWLKDTLCYHVAYK